MNSMVNTCFYIVKYLMGQVITLVFFSRVMIFAYLISILFLNAVAFVLTLSQG